MTDYPTITKSFSNIGSRNDVRKRVVDFFSKEIPGKGNKNETSRYTYFIETLKGGKRIYLTRPAIFKKGFDFLIHIEGFIFEGKQYKDAPRHSDILDDLKNKKKENPVEYKKMFKIIECIFLCKQEAEISLDLEFKTGYPSEMIIKVIKWFFIEQDINFWNYSGRGMLFQNIKEI